MAMIRSTGPRHGATVGLFALSGLLATVLAGCNPSFLSQFGIDPATLAQSPNGFVVVNFSNETDTTARLQIEVQTATAVTNVDFGPTIDDPRFSGVDPQESETNAFDCDVSQVLVLSAEVLVPEDVAILDFVQVTTPAGAVEFQLQQVGTIAAGFVQVPVVGVPGSDNPLCGSVVTFSLTGALDVPVRTFFDTVSRQTVTAPAFILNVDPPFPQVTDFLIRVRVQ